MAAAIHNFIIEQGTTVRKVFRLKDGTNLPLNLTGYKARLQSRLSIASPAVLLDATTENGKLVVDPLEGSVSLVLTASDSAALVWSKAKYDLELENSAGEVFRPVKGEIIIDKEVTRG